MLRDDQFAPDEPDGEELNGGFDVVLPPAEDLPEDILDGSNQDAGEYGRETPPITKDGDISGRTINKLYEGNRSNV